VRRAGIVLAACAALLTAILLAAARVGERPGALSDWQALVLGVVQGFTELLPISSSGHLIIVPWVADWTYLEHHKAFNKTFDVALHVGTLVAVIAYFWRDIGLLIAAWFRSIYHRRISTGEERLAWYVLLATIPAAIAGAVGEEFIEEKLGQPWQIALLMAVFAVVLWAADRSPERRKMDQLGFKAAFVIGLAQCLALAPGVSRSGITITAGRFLDLKRDDAARFSFLLLVPIVFGAAVLKGIKDVAFKGLPPGSAGPFVVGTLAAAVTGYIAIRALLGYLRRNDYTIFVVYRLVLAGAIIALIASGVRGAHFG
jgi:undecaprenyl-diphosphatase